LFDNFDCDDATWQIHAHIRTELILESAFDNMQILGGFITALTIQGCQGSVEKLILSQRSVGERSRREGSLFPASCLHCASVH